VFIEEEEIITSNKSGDGLDREIRPLKSRKSKEAINLLHFTVNNHCFY